MTDININKTAFIDNYDADGDLQPDRAEAERIWTQSLDINKDGKFDVVDIRPAATQDADGSSPTMLGGLSEPQTRALTIAARTAQRRGQILSGSQDVAGAIDALKTATAAAQLIADYTIGESASQASELAQSVRSQVRAALVEGRDRSLQSFEALANKRDAVEMPDSEDAFDALVEAKGDISKLSFVGSALETLNAFLEHATYVRELNVLDGSAVDIKPLLEKGIEARDIVAKRWEKLANRVDWQILGDKVGTAVAGAFTDAFIEDSWYNPLAWAVFAGMKIGVLVSRWESAKYRDNPAVGDQAVFDLRLWETRNTKNRIKSALGVESPLQQLHSLLSRVGGVVPASSNDARLIRDVAAKATKLAETRARVLAQSPDGVIASLAAFAAKPLGTVDGKPERRSLRSGLDELTQKPYLAELNQLYHAQQDLDQALISLRRQERHLSLGDTFELIDLRRDIEWMVRGDRRRRLEVVEAAVEVALGQRGIDPKKAEEDPEQAAITVVESAYSDTRDWIKADLPEPAWW